MPFDRFHLGSKLRSVCALEDLEAKLKEFPNPFGDGNASMKIVEALKEFC